ncbi:hypothetical protein J2X57_002782 [Luteibacter sp. 1214]|uniref:reverse transcriptase family protein n=1 Tax=Luteibacter sp. 1214 TaxID=2817735 RepID=UPI00285F767E|nr:reverse transcriptase family protein [Luteibacter sp. 1214]MDR6643561.1 hypothetical protein [Luteibacter sp. 1214]
MSLQNFIPDLSRPTSLETLAKALALNGEVLKELVEVPDPQSLYKVHFIPKRVKGERGRVKVREVWEPQWGVINFVHKAIARRLGAYLTSRVAGFPHPAAYGFVAGRSTRANADAHKGALRLVSADIADFFPSVSTGMVEGALKQAGLSKEASRILAKFLAPCGSMKPGFHSSPILCNLVLMPLDAEFEKFAAERSLVYTRYADDLTFSGADNLPSRAEIEKVLQRHGFELNQSKFRASKRGQKHYVTGLAVTDGNQPRIPRKMKKRLFQELHFIEKFGIEGHRSRLKGAPSIQHLVNRIEGTISYVASIEKQLAPDLWKRWTSICEASTLRKSFKPRPYDVLREAVWLVDEAEFEAYGEKCLAVLCAEPFDVSRSKQALAGFVRAQSEDAFLSASKAKQIREFGVHWADLDESQRSSFVEVMEGQVVRCLAAFAPLNGDYKETYRQLFSRLIEQKMHSADDADVTVYVENNPRITQDEMRDMVEKVFLNQFYFGKRRPPSSPSVVVQSKKEADLLAYADSLLGIMGRYLAFSGNQPDGHFVRFKRLSMSYQLIFDGVRKRVWRGRASLMPFSMTPEPEQTKSRPVA